ncbi:hypothetical protein CDD83_7204 [Cordyceps sp. RAO-2017]|nr:hypothetical protein CDD83_7204 [Cordyceps sp. RAO-2017]
MFSPAAARPGRHPAANAAGGQGEVPSLTVRDTAAGTGYRGSGGGGPERLGQLRQVFLDGLAANPRHQHEEQVRLAERTHNARFLELGLMAFPRMGRCICAPRQKPRETLL